MYTKIFISCLIATFACHSMENSLATTVKNNSETNNKKTILPLSVLIANQLVTNPKMMKNLSQDDKAFCESQIAKVYEENFMPYIFDNNASSRSPLPQFIAGKTRVIEPDFDDVLNYVQANKAGSFFMLFARKTIMRGNFKTGKIEYFKLFTNDFNPALAAISEDGTRCLLTNNKSLYVLSFDETKMNMVLQKQGEYKDTITSVAFSSDTSTIAIGCTDGTITFVNCATNKQKNFKINGKVTSLSMLNSSTIVASAEDVFIIDATEQQPMRIIKGVGKTIKRIVSHAAVQASDKIIQEHILAVILDGGAIALYDNLEDCLVELTGVISNTLSLTDDGKNLCVVNANMPAPAKNTFECYSIAAVLEEQRVSKSLPKEMEKRLKPISVIPLSGCLATTAWFLQPGARHAIAISKRIQHFNTAANPIAVPMGVGLRLPHEVIHTTRVIIQPLLNVREHITPEISALIAYSYSKQSNNKFTEPLPLPAKSIWLDYYQQARPEIQKLLSDNLKLKTPWNPWNSVVNFCSSLI